MKHIVRNQFEPFAIYEHGEIRAGDVIEYEGEFKGLVTGILETISCFLVLSWVGRGRIEETKYDALGGSFSRRYFPEYNQGVISTCRDEGEFELKKRRLLKAGLQEPSAERVA